MTKVIEEADINILVNAINQGEIVSFPTETVYGVACRFNDREALDRLMEAKNRDYSKAVTLMVSKKEDIDKYAYTSPNIMRVVDDFTPGRLTIILKKRESVDPAMTNGRETIGIRIPDCEFVLRLIDQTGPLLVTSANISGKENTTNEREVLKQLDGRISYVVKGQTDSSVASTVVDLTGDEPKVLREGILTQEEIRRSFYENRNRM